MYLYTQYRETDTKPNITKLFLQAKTIFTLPIAYLLEHIENIVQFMKCSLCIRALCSYTAQLCSHCLRKR